jgi:hypothetical protein
MELLAGINQTLSASRLIIEGALADPEMIKILEAYGYNRKRLQQSKAQLEKTWMLFDSKETSYQEMKRATLQLKTQRSELRQTYLKHAGILRAYYRDDAATLEELGLNQSTPNALDRFIIRTQRFYTKARSLGEATPDFPIQDEEMAQAQAMITAIGEARVQQLSKKREAQRTTQQQNEAIKELRQWVRDFVAIAKIAFRHDPQQLEALGIVAKTV